MKGLKLLELLRYGFAGGIFLVLLLIAYDDPRAALATLEANGVLAAALLGLSLAVGSVIYSLHRAVPYRLLYRLFASLNGRVGSILDLDIQRWRHLDKPGALQPRLDEWAAQAHFLYCIAWSGFGAIVIGRVGGWKQRAMWPAVLFGSTVVLAAALWNHCRYQRWEKRVFKEDDQAFPRTVVPSS